MMTMPTPKCPKCGRNMDFCQMGKGDEDYWECDPYPNLNAHEDCVNIWHSDAQADYIAALEAQLADLERQLTALRLTEDQPPEPRQNPECPTCKIIMILNKDGHGAYWECPQCQSQYDVQKVEFSPTVRELHDAAMNLAQYMHISKHEKWGLTNEVFIAAYELEYQAAKEAIRHAEEQQRECEPTRSILLKSAAWLAWNAELWEDAIETANECLRGKPDDIIRAEMADCIARSKKDMRDE